MAVTAATRNSIIQLVVTAYNAAPGTALLTQLVEASDGGASLADIATTLTTSSTFKAIYPTFQTSTEFATEFLGNLVPEASAAALAEGISVVESVLNGGGTRADVILQASAFLAALSESDASFGTSAALFNNKVEVATYHTVTLELDSESIATLQSTLATVTSSDDSVTAAKAAADSTANPPAAGQTFTLTANIDNSTLGAGDDTFTGNTAAGVQTLTALDAIDGAAGTDTLNITTTADITSLSPAGSSISNVEIINLTSNGSVTADTSATTITGTTALTASAADEVVLAADSSTNITAVSSSLAGDNSTIDGGNNVAYTVAGGTSGTVDIGASTAPAGTVSYTGAYAQADGSTHGAVTVTGGTNVTVTLSTANAVNTDNTFGAVTVTGGTSTSTVSVSQTAAATKGLTARGVINGDVTVNDANRTSSTKAGSITDVTIASGADVTINSGALENIFASGKFTTIDASTLGALTTAAINDIHLHVNGVTTTGAVTFDTDVTTININGHTAASTIASLVDASATKVNILGDAKVTVSAHTLSSAAVISTADSTGGATFSGALGTGVTYTGGAGADTISIGATTKTITTGAGNDTVTVGASALGYQGSLDAGDGTDTLSMTAANAITATASATFEGTIAGFERLTVGDAAASGTIALANLDDINYVKTADVATGETLTITGATSGFTLVNNVGTTGTGAITVTLADATGSADELNVSVSASAAKDIQGLTATGFEVLNFATDDSATTPTGIAHVVSALTDADATTITVTGDAGLDLTFTGTKVTSFNASGVTKGAVDWTSGALAASATVLGGAGANTIDLSASSKAMTYTGGAAVDTITTGAGNDVITTAAGNDVIVAGNGTNTVDAGAGNDNITTGTGADTINAGAGNDTIVAGAGANVINGEDGNDSITGGSAADTVDGGDGTDTFIADLTEQAGSGTTVGAMINLSASAVTQATVYSTTGSYLSSAGATVASNTVAYLYNNESTTNAVVVDTLTSIENASGTSGKDYIVGSAAANTIDGQGGADYMTGGAGVDTFVQDASDSVVLTAETVTEAAIAATETITFGSGVDIISDFTAGNGGDILNAQAAGAPTSALGSDQTADTSGTMYFLSGNFVASTGVFTITADGAGSDTLIFEGDAGADLSAVNDAVVLVGVDSDDLVAANII